MEIYPEWKEFLELLEKNRVEYLLIGGLALGAHGRPRATGDMDIFIGSSPENARRVIQSLSDFGFGSLGITEGDLTKRDQFILLGRPPRRIDLITGISGVEFAAAYKARVMINLQGVQVSLISEEHLIQNKKASGRERDLEDVRKLQQKLGSRKGNASSTSKTEKPRLE